MLTVQCASLDTYRYSKPKGDFCIPFEFDPEDEPDYGGVLAHIAYKRWEEDRWNEF